jgi:hypothetical protein
VDAIAAVGGVDNIVAPLLKASMVRGQWLHRVIVAVWVSGKALRHWKRALIVPLPTNQGQRQCQGCNSPPAHQLVEHPWQGVCLDSAALC